MRTCVCVSSLCLIFQSRQLIKKKFDKDKDYNLNPGFSRNNSESAVSRWPEKSGWKFWTCVCVGVGMHVWVRKTVKQKKKKKPYYLAASLSPETLGEKDNMVIYHKCLMAHLTIADERGVNTGVSTLTWDISPKTNRRITPNGTREEIGDTQFERRTQIFSTVLTEMINAIFPSGSDTVRRLLIAALCTF